MGELYPPTTADYAFAAAREAADKQSGLSKRLIELEERVERLENSVVTLAFALDKHLGNAK